MWENGVDLISLITLPFTSVMVKLVTWSTPAWSFLTAELLSSVTTASTAAAVTAVVKLRLWLPRLTLLSPRWSVVRTKLSDTRARRWRAVGWSCLFAATSLPCARPLGYSGDGAIEERAAGSV